MTEDLTTLSDDELASEITTWAGRVAAGEARLLELIGEFDARGGWGGIGMLSCAHWLSWRIGMGPVAARERVRVARRLRELPLTREAFAAGRLSWSQVRAITRCAAPETEESLVDLARHATAAMLEKVSRGIRQVHEAERLADDPDAMEQSLLCSTRYDTNGTLVITLRVPPAQAQVAMAGLERWRAEVQSERQEAAVSIRKDLVDAVPDEAAPDEAVTGEPPSDASAEAPPGEEQRQWKREQTIEAAVLAEARHRGVDVRPATLGDALARMAAQALEAPLRAPVPTQRLRLMVDPLSGWARTTDGQLLAPETMTGVLRALPGRSGDGPALSQQPLRPAPSWTAYDLGRTSRLVSGPLRALLGQIDGERCRFPGCSRVTKLHAHHVRFWRDGGPTDLANLVLVCSRHHTLIHRDGFQLVLSPDRTLTVRTQADIPVLQRPEYPFSSVQEFDVDERIGPDTLPPLWDGDPLDLGHVVWAFFHQAA